MELYIHIPFCMKKCEYCDFLSGVYDTDTRMAYTNALCREIEFFGRKYAKTTIETIFIGGGTPTWLETRCMDQIMDTVWQSFSIADDAEISMECNPGTASLSAFSSYRRWGLNRLSIGLQSANDDELRLLGRVHTYDRFLKTFENARRCGIFNINIDIMTGLPGQTQEKLYHTLNSVCGLKPEHISAYALTIEKGTPFYERYKFDAVKQHAAMKTEFLPDDEEVYRLGKLTEAFLAEKGYKRYEISNYAKEGMECRHNIGYWIRTPYLGVGLGASSLISNIRYQNERDMGSYIIKSARLKDESADSVLWDEKTELQRTDEVAEYMYLGLRMTEGISRSRFEESFGQSVDTYYRGVMEELKQQGLMSLDGGRIRLTDRGLDVYNRAAAMFLL